MNIEATLAQIEPGVGSLPNKSTIIYWSVQPGFIAGAGVVDFGVVFTPAEAISIEALQSILVTNASPT